MPLVTDRTQDRAIRSVARTFGLLERVMQPYFARFGISGSQWAVLRMLHRAEQEGHPALRLTDLSERLLIRPPSVTGVVDRLERDGLLQRDSARDDLRVKEVRLTPKGRQLVTRILSVHADQVELLMSGLNAAEQADLHRLLEQLSGHLQGLLHAQQSSGD